LGAANPFLQVFNTFDGNGPQRIVCGMNITLAYKMQEWTSTHLLNGVSTEIIDESVYLSGVMHIHAATPGGIWCGFAAEPCPDFAEGEKRITTVDGEKRFVMMETYRDAPIYSNAINCASPPILVFIVGDNECEEMW
jgi:hypothetical protein